MSDPRYPALYQINTRVWLTELSRALGRRATLDDVPDAELDRLAAMGFDWVWFLSVWQTGPAAQAISRANPEWRHEFAETLPDLKDEDIAGSGFAIQSYTVHRDLGGAAALARLRQRLQKRGLKLLLDFVPNHMALDHPWIDGYPDYFVRGSENDLAHSPRNYCRVQTRNGPLVFANGRDPYFDGWPDTLQLNYGNPDLQQAMIGELESIAEQCDGVRCDMAMLVLPDVFERTAAVNFAPEYGQCYVGLPFHDLDATRLRLKDLMGTETYDRDGDDLQGRGLFLDVPPWHYHVFEIHAKCGDLP
jgi:glycosidase